MNLRELLFLHAASGGGGSLVEYTATGNPVAFNTNVAKPLNSVTVPLTYTQSGTGDPSPSNIRPISGVSSLSAYRTGINIFDEELEEGMLNTSTGQNSPSSSNIRSKNYISVVPGKKYYIKYKTISGTNMRIFLYYADKSYKSNSWSGVSSFTIPADVHYVRFYMDTSYSASDDRKISINYPNTETDYVPYSGGAKLDVTFPVDVGTVYGGSLDLVSGVLTITFGSVDLGSLTWEDKTNGNVKFFYSSEVSDAKRVAQTSETANIACDRLKTASGKDIYNGAVDNAIGANSTQNPRYRAIATGYEDASEFKTAMNGVMLYYELKTPVTVQLTPAQASAFVGDNTVWTNTTGNLTIKYLNKA